MMIILSALAFDSLTGCYSDKSTVTLDRNIQIFKVKLFPVNDSCSIFPYSVGINLTFSGHIFHDSLNVKIQNFDFYNTTEIDIPYSASMFDPPKTIDDFDATFCFVTVYSYSEQAYQEIMIQQERKSDMTNCFSSLDVYLEDSELEVTAVPTSQCKIQIDSQANSPINYVSDIYIQFNAQKYILSTVQMDNFINNYQNGQVIQVVFTDKAQLLQSLSEIKPEIQLVITLLQGQLEIQLQYDIEQIVYYTIPGLFGANAVTKQAGRFFSIFRINNAISAALEQQISYDLFTYRFTAYDNDATFTYQESLQTHVTEQFLEIECGADENCNYFMNGNTDSTHYYMDFILSNHAKVIYVMRLLMELQESYFSDFDMIETDTQFCANGRQTVSDQPQSSMRFVILDKTGQNASAVILTAQSQIDVDHRRFCFDKNGAQKFDSSYYILEVATRTGFAQTVSEGVQLEFPVQLVILPIGALVVSLILVEVIFEMVKLKQTLKRQKKNKRKE
uniref:Transmembrane protein n=1 Tax=Trepomonas sp. PC1 TaxID=1076344 RepID=A0A146K5G7_9EUKA|eukprot:JAP90801.1 Hypothetical protein TPC1_17792 [Trepomonas sp. PC1]